MRDTATGGLVKVEANGRTEKILWKHKTNTNHFFYSEHKNCVNFNNFKSIYFVKRLEKFFFFFLQFLPNKTLFAVFFYFFLFIDQNKRQNKKRDFCPIQFLFLANLLVCLFVAKFWICFFSVCFVCGSVFICFIILQSS